ncbi:helicase/secretion neighborhood TadE-like protein [Corynebacterium mustelae]|uniref:Helicase/secretion neighborhood TadE-like protein n=1 Tax=Corynebacterium mustelae TaxID=571915 RepID=A0A0G3H3A6_9CORY|nr:Rv3654c family TadE-like protein [Corynebacterium mustelae]AKK07220.1 helicase/secretion neighborhood TadE-like protein [Corynebacterium mustelae]
MRHTMIHDEAGSATVTTAGLIAALSAVLLVIASLINTTIASHRAQVAADLAAVAGAWAVYSGEHPCRKADYIAQLNQATIYKCSVFGSDVTVIVVENSATATARAGPR